MITTQYCETARLEAKDRVGPGSIVAAPSTKAARSRSDESAEAPRIAHAPIVLIEPRTLIRDCIAKCLEASSGGEPVLGFASASDWIDARQPRSVPPLILLSTSGFDETQIEREIALVAEAESRASIVLLADDADSRHVLEALDKGARGYISTSMTFDVTVNGDATVEPDETFFVNLSGVSQAKPESPAAFRSERRFQCAAVPQLGSKGGVFISGSRRTRWNS